MLLGLQAVLSLNQDRKSPLLCENKMVFPLDEQPYVVMEEYFKARIGQKTVSKLTLSYFLWENLCIKSCAYLPHVILRLFASLLLALFVCRNDKKTFILDGQRWLWHPTGFILGKDRWEGWLHFLKWEDAGNIYPCDQWPEYPCHQWPGQEENKSEIFLNKSQYNIITLPLINGRKCEGGSPYQTSHFFPFCISSQHQKLFPSMFQAMICLISLSLSFHSRPTSSKSFSTEVRYASHLDFYSSHSKNSNYWELCCQHEDLQCPRHPQWKGLKQLPCPLP